jgi:hypothetical protein
MALIKTYKSLLRKTERAAKGELQFSKNLRSVGGIRFRQLSPL